MKIDKALLFVGKKGTYLNINIWINDKPDQFNNDASIEQQTPKGSDKNYIGNGKFYEPQPVQIDKEDSDDEIRDMPF